MWLKRKQQQQQQQQKKNSNSQNNNTTTSMKSVIKEILAFHDFILFLLIDLYDG